jgi:hypothetical protein
LKPVGIVWLVGAGRLVGATPCGAKGGLFWKAFCWIFWDAFCAACNGMVGTGVIVGEINMLEWGIGIVVVIILPEYSFGIVMLAGSRFGIVAGASYDVCWTGEKFEGKGVTLGWPIASLFLPGRMCRVCSPISTLPFSGMNRAIKLISFWSPPASSQGSQTL